MKNARSAFALMVPLVLCSCESSLWSDQCFYKLTITSEEIETLGTGRLSAAFNPQFEQFQKDPTSPPPLIGQNELVFADECDLPERNNCINYIFEEDHSLFQLEPIQRKDYLAYFEGQGG